MLVFYFKGNGRLLKDLSWNLSMFKEIFFNFLLEKWEGKNRNSKRDFRNNGGLYR